MIEEPRVEVRTFRKRLCDFQRLLLLHVPNTGQWRDVVDAHQWLLTSAERGSKRLRDDDNDDERAPHLDPLPPVHRPKTSRIMDPSKPDADPFRSLGAHPRG